MKSLLVVIERWRRSHFLEVVPGAKRFAFGGQNDYPHRFIVGNRIELALQGREHRLRQGVEGLRTVQRQRDHTTRILASQEDWLVSPEGFRGRCRLD